MYFFIVFQNKCFDNKQIIIVLTTFNLCNFNTKEINENSILLLLN